MNLTKQCVKLRGIKVGRCDIVSFWTVPFKMPSNRALVECAVLALQDSCVVYPSCKSCFSRVEAEETRLTCSKCGYSCDRTLLDHRYRLAVRVARGSCMFGVTVFGSCLNQFFGIHASGLQRLVTDKSGTLDTSKSTLLVKAVEECFIGKHFIFGIKVAENDIKPWVKNTKGNSHFAQLIATQMILPKTAGHMGCTVLNYYEAAFQKSTETKQCTTDPNEMKNHIGGAIWPPPHIPPTPGFTNDTLHSSGFLPWSFSRSCPDRSLSPTPPWQQTLGLITSSAEQEESSKDYNTTPRFSEKCSRSMTPLKAWQSLSTPVHKTTGRLTLPPSGLTKSFLNNCPAQEGYPCSESLTEFLKDKNSLDISQQTEMFLGTVHDDIDLMDKRQVYCGFIEDKTAASTQRTEARDVQSEGSIYNCSADLFYNSPRIDMDTTLLASLPVCQEHASVDLLHSQSLLDSSTLTPKQPLSEKENDQNQAKCNIRESFRLSANFDFIPPSQSTPAERVTVQKQKALLSDFPIRYTDESTKENINCANQNTRCLCLTPKSRNMKPDQIQCGLLKKKHFSSCRRVLNSTVYRRRSSGFGDKDALIVPPTPAHLLKESLLKYNKEQTFNVTSKSINKTDCTSCECGQTVDESECNTANEECDWSKDLFSDSA